MNIRFGDETTISVIVPTRKRVARLTTFLDSLRDTMERPDRVEIILVVDDDDTDMVGYRHPDVACTIVTVPAGRTMGVLNNAGYAASRGDIVMLLNDDVIARTKGWDRQLREQFAAIPDGVALLHVNDLIFQRSLCTFPCVSRTYCELADGICPEDYARYRIDDHIYHVFTLLGVLGKVRIIYLPDVIFEHTNISPGIGTERYVPVAEIHEADTTRFEKRLSERHELAVRLAEIIDDFRRVGDASRRRAVLSPHTDAGALRRPEYSKVRHADAVLTSRDTRVTIGVVSADLRSAHTAACLEAIKAYTTNYDLIVLDNNRGPGFNHAREMNRLRAICTTDYLVLLDDDVFVGPGWLDGLLRCLTPQVGLVTPLHEDTEGRLSYAGIVLSPDRSGIHWVTLRVPHEPVPVQSICSAAMLIDMTKCGHLFLDESYSKYFFDLDYGLRVWEAGYEVVVSPYTLVTHLGGATLAHGSFRAVTLFHSQRAHFVKEWMLTGRYQRIELEIWAKLPALASLVSIPERFQRALADMSAGVGDPRPEIQTIFHEVEEIPHLREWLVKLLRDFVRAHPRSEEFAWASSYLGGSIEVEADYEGFQLVFRGGRYHALPRNGVARIGRALAGWSAGQYSSDELDALKGRIRAAGHAAPDLPPAVRDRPVRRMMKRAYLALNIARSVLRAALKKTPPASANTDRADSRKWLATSPEKDLQQTYSGHRIYRYEFKYFGVPDTIEKFTYQDFIAGRYTAPIPITHSIPELKAAIDRLQEGSAGNTLLISPYDTLPVRATDLGGLAGRGKIESLTEMLGIAPGELLAWANRVSETELAALAEKLRGAGIRRALIPWRFPDSWRGSRLEELATKLVSAVDIIHESGMSRTYAGENAHRLIYNKAYLSSMFSVVPRPNGLRVLEVGCSDGMVCDILAQLGAREVHGVDLMGTVGCSFRGPNVHYQSASADALPFPDGSFDLTYSIATLEHVPDPSKVLREMLRVTKVGGWCYAQAGPLYHSPFGHHMFAYFPDHPWIHLRKSKAEILAYMQAQGIDKRIEQDFGISCEEYLTEMLSRDHINGLFLRDYGLDSIVTHPCVRMLKLHTSYEGENLLDEKVLAEVGKIDRSRLIEHGFEIAFQRRPGSLSHSLHTPNWRYYVGAMLPRPLLRVLLKVTGRQ